MVTLKRRPLFFVKRNTAAARQALAEQYPAAVQRMKPGNWTGPAFIVAKLLEAKKPIPAALSEDK